MSAAAAQGRHPIAELSAIELTDQYARRLAKLLRWWHARMAHKSGEGRCLPYTEIREYLGSTAKALATGFFEATGWNHAEHLQRSWTLTPAGEAAMQIVSQPPAQEQPSERAQATKPTGRPRTRSVNRNGKAGNRAPDCEHIVRHPDIDLDMARATINISRDKLKTSTDPKAITRLQETIAQLESAIAGEICFDYRQTTTGRLQGQGLHPQNFTREARAALFPDCYDIDVENCHPTIIQYLARQHGINDSPGLDDYIENKRQWRKRISRDIGADIKAVKACFLALMYGASTNTDQVVITRSGKQKKIAIVDELGEEKAKLFAAHQDVIDLRNDLAIIRRVVVRSARANANRLGNIKNAAGLSIHHSARPAEILSHIAQGIESEILREILAQLDQPAELGQHDGAVIRDPLTDYQLEAIADHVEKTIGISIQLEQEPLQPGFAEWQKHKTDTFALTALTSFGHFPSAITDQNSNSPSQPAGQPHAPPPSGQPATVNCNGSLESLYLLRVTANSFGFVRGENQPESRQDSGVSDRLNEPIHKPP